MDGLAATLAIVSCAYFAIDALTAHENETVLALAISLGLACGGFLPFNLRPQRGAAVFMGDSGAQLIGFGLASLALAASWTVAGTTVATILLPLLVLAIPILDTTLVTVARLVEKRPVTQGGRDHTSHRLVYYGLSETKAVLLLAIVASAIGATALAYNVLDNGRLTAIGVLLTFVLLVQFGSFLSNLEERSRRGIEGPEPSLWRALIFEPRRLVEVFADFVLICVSFLVAYALAVGGTGTDFERSVYLSALPILLASRYVFFVALGVYRRVWRYATARDVVPIVVGCFGSAVAACVILVALRPIGSFPAVQIFAIDAILCTILVGASRLALRLLPETFSSRGGRKRVLVVGAGRAGRSLARELREGRDARVVGFLDDNPRVRRRRILGISVVGSLDEADRAIANARADEVLVSIPSAPAGTARRWSSAPPRARAFRAGSSAGTSSSPHPRRSRPRAREHRDAGGRRAPPGLPRALPLGGAAARPLLRARRALRLAGIASSRPHALHRRARADAARTRDRPHRGAGATRRAVRWLRIARCLRPRPGLVAGIVDSLVGGGEADPRPRDDRDDLSGVRAGADGRAEVVRARRCRRGGCSARARVRAVPRRGATRVPDRDARPLADRAHARAPELGSRRSRVRSFGRCGTDADAARRPVRRVRARPALARVGLGGRQTLALLVADVGLGRLRDPARRSRSGLLGADGAPLDELARDDRLLQGPGLRSRRLGARSPLDRDRDPARAPRHCGARPSEERAAHTGDLRLRRHERRGTCRVRVVRGDQGCIPPERLLDRRRRAKRDLPRPDPLRIGGDGGRTGCRTRVGDRRGGSVHRLHRRKHAAPSQSVPVLRGARALDRRLREPQAGLVGRDDRRRAHRRMRRRARRRRRAEAAAAPVGRLCRRCRQRCRRRGCVGPDRTGLRRRRGAALLRVVRQRPAASVHLGRRSDGRGVRRRHRAADHRPHEHPADGVLQSVDAEDVERSTEPRSRSAARSSHPT